MVEPADCVSSDRPDREYPALSLTKRAIDQAYEARGLMTALAHGVDAFDELTQTPEAEAFNRAVAEQGPIASLADLDDGPAADPSLTA
jgi:hypothetical protein